MTISALTVFLTALKLIATGLGGVFGVFALVVDYKDDEGKITKWGRIALIGVVASALVSGAIQSLEYVSADLNGRAAAEKTVEQLRRTEQVLTQLERVAHPLDPPRMTVVWKLPKTFAGGQAFMIRLKAFGKKLRTNPSIADDGAIGIFVTSLNADGVPLSFEIQPGSSLYPSHATDPELFYLVTYTDGDVSLFQNREKADAAVKEIKAQPRRPSLGYFGQNGDYGFSVDTEAGTRLQYDIENENLLIWIDSETDSNYLRQNGSIISVPDFERSIALLSASHGTVPEISGNFPNLVAARKQIRPSTIFIRTSGREYIFRVNDINITTTVSGYPIFTFGPISDGLY